MAWGSRDYLSRRVVVYLLRGCNGPGTSDLTSGRHSWGGGSHRASRDSSAAGACRVFHSRIRPFKQNRLDKPSNNVRGYMSILVSYSPLASWDGESRSVSRTLQQSALQRNRPQHSCAFTLHECSDERSGTPNSSINLAAC